MGFEDEDAIAEYQKGLEEEESEDDRGANKSGEEDDENALLDIEALKMREDLTEK